MFSSAPRTWVHGKKEVNRDEMKVFITEQKEPKNDG